MKELEKKVVTILVSKRKIMKFSKITVSYGLTHTRTWAYAQFRTFFAQNRTFFVQNWP